MDKKKINYSSDKHAFQILFNDKAIPVYSRSTHPLGNSNLLQTSVYCAFHLSTLNRRLEPLFLTLLQDFGEKEKEKEKGTNVTIPTIDLMTVPNIITLSLSLSLSLSLQKESDFLSLLLSLDQHSRPTFFQHIIIVLID